MLFYVYFWRNLIRGNTLGKLILNFRGGQMSGGMKHRISIPRAILRRPKSVILDDASSVFDAVSERVMQDAPHRTGDLLACIEWNSRWRSRRTLRCTLEILNFFCLIFLGTSRNTFTMSEYYTNTHPYSFSFHNYTWQISSYIVKHTEIL